MTVKSSTFQWSKDYNFSTIGPRKVLLRNVHPILMARYNHELYFVVRRKNNGKANLIKLKFVKIMVLV